MAGRGEDVFDLYLPLVRCECQPGLGLAIRNEALRRRRAIRSAYAPRRKPSAPDHAELTGWNATVTPATKKRSDN